MLYSKIISRKAVQTVEQREFARRLTELRIEKNVSARDMSLSIGQSAGYINNIENGVNYPSMTAFFYICDYLGITPKDFFDCVVKEPQHMDELIKAASQLDCDQLSHLTAIAKYMNSR